MTVTMMRATAAPTRRQIILSPNAPKPASVYSQAVKTRGLLFLAGQLPLDPISGELVTGSVSAEVDCVIANLRAVLSSGGAALGDIVKTTVYFTNIGDFAELNQAYGRYFRELPPARTSVVVLALPRGARVEIDAIAVLP